MNNIEERITALVDTLTSDYGKGRIIDEIKPFPHPDEDVLQDIISQLRSLVFPAHFRNKALKSYIVRNNTSMVLENIIYNLTEQIKRVLHYSPEFQSVSDDEIAEKSQELTFAFIEKIPKVREYIETDVQAAFEGDPAAFSKDEIIFSYPGLFAIFVNRIAHELHLLGVPMIPRIMTEYAHSKTGIDIHPGATIGKYFFIDHGTGIVIGETTVIGDYVKIYQGVTLGALSTRGGQALKNKKRHPTIEDNVTIYSGASILGGETVVGKNVVIGGNTFITKSVSSGARVSVKAQELNFRYGNEKPEKKDIEQDETWFYII
ncbi:MAG: serine acetyltransferase [Ruminococcus sp.]|nr:serine acetyltransferase [Ruminococcus sp.]